MFSFDLVAKEVVAGILLGGFYAAVSLEISVTFGVLDAVNIAHPVPIVLGPHAAYDKEAAPFAWRKRIVRPVPVHAHDAFLRK